MLQYLVKRADGGATPFKEHSRGCGNIVICSPPDPMDQNDLYSES